jgi:hypothetical protein
MLIAASVRAIDDAPIPFPKSRAELDATLDALAEEGLTAGIVAYGRLLQAGGVPPEKVVETAKN